MVHMSINKNIFLLFVKPSVWASDSSRLPVVFDIVGGHDGLIHRVENNSIHIHRDRITGQDLWVVSYHKINYTSSCSLKPGFKMNIFSNLHNIWRSQKVTELGNKQKLHRFPQTDILKPKLILISLYKCDKSRVTAHSALMDAALLSSLTFIYGKNCNSLLA